MFSVDARVASRAPDARDGRGDARSRARAMSTRCARAARGARARHARRATDASTSRERDDEDEDEDEDEDGRERAERLAAVVNCYDVAALSASATRASSYVREELAGMTTAQKMIFMDALSSTGIENAWTIAGEGYALTRAERAASAGSTKDFHAANEILGDDDANARGDGVRVFEGRVAKLPTKFLNRFAKAFYVDEDDDPMRSAASRRFLGRAPIKKGPLDALLPLYFASNDFTDDSVTIPGTAERADLSLDYRDVPVLATRRPLASRAGGVSWPAPRLALYPFDALVDYIRPLAPGVLVGRGYRFKADVPRRFLDFVLVRRE